MRVKRRNVHNPTAGQFFVRFEAETTAYILRVTYAVLRLQFLSIAQSVTRLCFTMLWSAVAYSNPSHPVIAGF